MVCLGNICRSPLAEGILKAKIDTGLVLVDSAGTAGYHKGNPPDVRSVAIAMQNGIDISKQKSRIFCVSDFDAFDYICVMDMANYNDVLRLARNKKDIAKVFYALEGNLNVPDPYYGGVKGFENVYNTLDSSCDTIIEKLNLPKIK